MPGHCTLYGDRPPGPERAERTPHVIRRGDANVDANIQGWIGRMLHEAYDGILLEPIPAEFSVLLRRIDTDQH